MNQSVAYLNESKFGPPSELIDISAFLIDTQGTYSIQVPGGDWEHVQEECSLDDIRDYVSETLNTPARFGSVSKQLEEKLNTLYSATDTATARGKKRKREGTQLKQSAQLETTADMSLLESVTVLKSWPYPAEAASFIRSTKNSDFNTLSKLSVTEESSPSGSRHDAVITISVYNRLSWGNHLDLFSRYAILASQTLWDLYKCISCPSNEMSGEESDVVHDTVFRASDRKGCVLCIEGVAYGDNQDSVDYAGKLMEQLEGVPNEKRPTIRKGPSLHDQKLSALTLRLNQPYWLLHQGNCEHFLVVEQIRLLHPSDPKDQYPITLHASPQLLDLCYACSKVPADLSIVGDSRLEQSPSLLCTPCWQNFAPDKVENGVIVIPLVRHSWSS